MNISKILIIVFLVLFVSIGTINSQTNKKDIPKPIKWEFGLKFVYSTASSFYNLNDSVITSMKYVSNDTLKQYTFDFYETKIKLLAHYYLFDKFLIFMNLPISFYSLEEKYLRDDYGIRENKKNYSLNRVDNIEIGLSKNWVLGSVSTGIASSVRIPTGFYNGLYNNPEYEFLSDGAFELHFETEVDVQIKQFTFENSIAIDFRDEEFENRIIWNSAIGVNSIPNTELLLFSEMSLSTAKFTSNTRHLVPHEEVAQENNYYAGAQFSILFSRNIGAKFGYQVSLAGKNSWKKGTSFVQFLYRM